MKFRSFKLTLLALLLCGVSYAQGLESELGFLYVKADYLLETDRFDEAILEFDKIVEQDPTYRDALFKRASAKFATSDFQGAKVDLLLSFEAIGITPEGILLFGKSQKNLNDHDAASKTLTTASMLFEDNGASKKPSSRMNGKSETSNKQEPASGESNEPKTPEKIKEGLDDLDEKVNDIMDDILGRTSEDGSTAEDTAEAEVEPENVYVPDMSINEIYVDEDLTIVIKDGLGGRRILEQPNILILSETSGEVAVDVCVNRNGKVESAVFNKDKSTLSVQSLVSLAVRKSKEFWFEAVDRDEICGSIIFRITGRS